METTVEIEHCLFNVVVTSGNVLLHHINNALFFNNLSKAALCKYKVIIKINGFNRNIRNRLN